MFLYFLHNALLWMVTADQRLVATLCVLSCIQVLHTSVAYKCCIHVLHTSAENAGITIKQQAPSVYAIDSFNQYVPIGINVLP